MFDDEREMNELFESREEPEAFSDVLASNNFSDYSSDYGLNGGHDSGIFNNTADVGGWYNASFIADDGNYSALALLDDEFNNASFDSGINATSVPTAESIKPAYLFLVFLLFSVFTVFGNVLVILSVCRERALQTVTNYFVVSLAVADVLVAAVPMPFGVYVLVNHQAWDLDDFLCDLYIAMDVTCSTSSILNLVAISIDRYIAVTRPIQYAKHKNNSRVALTIVLVWALSAAIGIPIVTGLNNTPDRDHSICAFFNSDFIIYSSLSSFYIPCIIMVVLYFRIFKALRERAKKSMMAKRTPKPMIIANVAANPGSNSTTAVAPAAPKAEDPMLPPSPALPGKGQPPSEEESPASDQDGEEGQCHIITNTKADECIEMTVVNHTHKCPAMDGNDVQTTGNENQAEQPGSNGAAFPLNEKPGNPGTKPSTENSDPTSDSRSSSPSPKRALLTANRNSRGGASSSDLPSMVKNNGGTPEAFDLKTLTDTQTKKDQLHKQAASSRFTIYKVHKASKRKRERSSAKKENKATKTLAIVLAVFLVCWVPFFTCNILEAISLKLGEPEAAWRPGVTLFLTTTWLGYINSFMNPIIYTVWNMEFRKAFRKILASICR